MEFAAGDGDMRVDLHYMMEPDETLWAFDARRAQLSPSTGRTHCLLAGGFTGLLSAFRCLSILRLSSLHLCVRAVETSVRLCSHSRSRVINSNDTSERSGAELRAVSQPFCVVICRAYITFALENWF
jgi:hypothetical protein